MHRNPDCHGVLGEDHMVTQPSDGVLYLGVALSLGCHGHIVRSAPNHSGAPFDFSSHPECSPAARPAEPPAPGEVEIRYLGAAGPLSALGRGYDPSRGLSSPTPACPGFSLGPGGRMTTRSRTGLTGIDVPAVEAVFAGHSHYDHIGDLPVVLGMADRAQVFVNRTGVHALAPYAAFDQVRQRFVKPDAVAARSGWRFYGIDTSRWIRCATRSARPVRTRRLERKSRGQTTGPIQGPDCPSTTATISAR